MERLIDNQNGKLKDTFIFKRTLVAARC